MNVARAMRFCILASILSVPAVFGQFETATVWHRSRCVGRHSPKLQTPARLRRGDVKPSRTPSAWMISPSVTVQSHIFGVD